MKYILTEKTYSDRTGYGITATDGTKTVAQVDDISPDKEKVIELVTLFNTSRLSPTHLFDVIEDLL